jgi:uncharacterized membrane protein
VRSSLVVLLGLCLCAFDRVFGLRQVHHLSVRLYLLLLILIAALPSRLISVPLGSLVPNWLRDILPVGILACRFGTFLSAPASYLSGDFPTSGPFTECLVLPSAIGK